MENNSGIAIAPFDCPHQIWAARLQHVSKPLQFALFVRRRRGASGIVAHVGVLARREKGHRVAHWAVGSMVEHQQRARPTVAAAYFAGANSAKRGWILPWVIHC